MAIIDNDKRLVNGLRADIMRKAMETKALLAEKGSLYIGTGTSDTVGNEIIPKTEALLIGTNGQILQVKNGGLEYGKINNDNFNLNTELTNAWVGKANEATHATDADHATNADHATSADSATNATNADQADIAVYATQSDKTNNKTINSRLGTIESDISDITQFKSSVATFSIAGTRQWHQDELNSTISSVTDTQGTYYTASVPASAFYPTKGAFSKMGTLTVTVGERNWALNVIGTASTAISLEQGTNVVSYDMFSSDDNVNIRGVLWYTGATGTNVNLYFKLICGNDNATNCVSSVSLRYFYFN